MITSHKKKFNWRAFVSLYVSFSFLIMIISGVVLYLSPAGRISKWTHIYILGLEKEGWQAIHTIFTFLFIIAGVFHMWYNWKPFISYLRSKMQRKISVRKELFASAAVTVLLFVFTLSGIPPFITVMEFSEYLTESWSTEKTEPPVPHAESMTLEELAIAIDKPVAELQINLNQHNINTSKVEVIQDIAEKYDITPMELFEKMKTIKKIDSSNPFAGSGLGRKTLREICTLENIDLDNSLRLLKENGFTANAESTIKEVADLYEKEPFEILELLLPKKAGI